MAKLLGIISLILAIVLFPPAALAVISNNAVPGDATYPIKRGLEDVIYAVASLTPTTKAWFAAARSDRRFQEVTALITQGKQAGDTLNELVEQTQIAASQIAQVSDQVQRTKLIEQLSGSIEKYDQGLEQIASEMPQTTTQPQATTLPSSSVVPSPSPTTQSTTSPTVRPIVQPTIQPTPNPRGENEERERQRQREIEEVRRRLEEIRRRLEEESSRHQINQTQSREERSGRSENRDNEQNSDNKKGDKPDKKEQREVEREKDRESEDGGNSERKEKRENKMER